MGTCADLMRGRRVSIVPTITPAQLSVPTSIEQRRQFYPQLPFVVLGSVDSAGDAWATGRRSGCWASNCTRGGAIASSSRGV